MTTITQIQRLLLNIIQQDFPLTEQPYETIANQLEITEDEVISHIKDLRRQNVIRQISAIFDTRRLGYKSCLVAMAYDPEDLHSAALEINKHPGVSHNYAREGSFYNLWFTLATSPKEEMKNTVDDMAANTKAKSCRLMPTIRFFKIGVNFDMVQKESAAYKFFSPDGYDKENQQEWNKAVTLSNHDIETIRELQNDLPLQNRPFDQIANRLHVTTQELFDIAQKFLDIGIMRRFSAVLHHRKAGFKANAMAVWKVPSSKSMEIGKIMAKHPYVTHCYERPTFPDWPYTHFTMIHATTKNGCEAAIKEISDSTGITDYLILYSSREYKKTRVKYFT